MLLNAVKLFQSISQYYLINKTIQWYVNSITIYYIKVNIIQLLI